MVPSRIEELRSRRSLLAQGGGEQSIDRQHRAWKLTARERIERLFDADTFRETYLCVRHRCTGFDMADNVAGVIGSAVAAGIFLASLT